MKTFLFTLLATIVANAAPLTGIKQLSCFSLTPDTLDSISVNFEMRDVCQRCTQPRFEQEIAVSAPVYYRGGYVTHNYVQNFTPDLTSNTKSFISYENLHPWFPKQLGVIYNGHLPIKMNFKNKILPLKCNFNHKG